VCWVGWLVGVAGELALWRVGGEGGRIGLLVRIGVVVVKVVGGGYGDGWFRFGLTVGRSCTSGPPHGSAECVEKAWYNACLVFIQPVTPCPATNLILVMCLSQRQMTRPHRSTDRSRCRGTAALLCSTWRLHKAKGERI
jgi:hypothetical protein